MSGSALDWWASLKRPYERAKKLAKLVECPQDDKIEMAKCIRYDSTTKAFDQLQGRPSGGGFQTHS